MIPVLAAYPLIKTAVSLLRDLRSPAPKTGAPARERPAPKPIQPKVHHAPNFAEIFATELQGQQSAALGETVAQRLAWLSHQALRSEKLDRLSQLSSAALQACASPTGENRAVLEEFQHFLRAELGLRPDQLTQVVQQLGELARGGTAAQEAFLQNRGESLALPA